MNAYDKRRRTAPWHRRLHPPLVAGLTAVALIRPLCSVTGLSDALGKPATPLILTAAISLTWILVVGLGRAPGPVPTLVAAGLGYALAVLVLSGVLSPALTGRLQGPLAQPIAIVPLFAVNALWGALCGVCAEGLRRRRAGRS
ncbi:hypothetical protein ACFZCY_27005 [Streptomyces sp. NPDC007983]|uniref:hypothetical protein n=1 Tax=Streptomyces sp. NPDC007983 TaxID=3364800 RepID=UPI0036F11A11